MSDRHYSAFIEITGKPMPLWNFADMVARAIHPVDGTMSNEIERSLFISSVEELGRAGKITLRNAATLSPETFLSGEAIWRTVVLLEDVRQFLDNRAIEARAPGQMQAAAVSMPRQSPSVGAPIWKRKDRKPGSRSTIAIDAISEYLSGADASVWPTGVSILLHWAGLPATHLPEGIKTIKEDRKNRLTAVKHSPSLGDKDLTAEAIDITLRGLIERVS
ncbi:hypothetical protein RCH10_003792 [Variovorax sp. GrIS 2.14]|uniref:hypothetical protein n=1 Tax=Variovorax sp. GrIS 2.14 TaxID=3071709 RepID=UPI0038F8184A